VTAKPGVLVGTFLQTCDALSLISEDLFEKSRYYQTKALAVGAVSSEKPLITDDELSGSVDALALQQDLEAQLREALAGYVVTVDEAIMETKRAADAALGDVVHTRQAVVDAVVGSRPSKPVPPTASSGDPSTVQLLETIRRLSQEIDVFEKVGCLLLVCQCQRCQRLHILGCNTKRCWFPVSQERRSLFTLREQSAELNQRIADVHALWMTKLATIREACRVLKGTVVTATSRQTAAVSRMLSDTVEGVCAPVPTVHGDNVVRSVLRGEPLPVIPSAFSGRPEDLFRHCVALEAELLASRAALLQLSAKLTEKPAPPEPTVPVTVVRDMEARIVELHNVVALQDAQRQYLETLLSESQFQVQAMMHAAQSRPVYPAEPHVGLRPIVEEPGSAPVAKPTRSAGIISSGGDGDGTPPAVISRRNSLPAKPRPSATGVISSSEWG
jgi:hypothetical protein